MLPAKTAGLVFGEAWDVSGIGHRAGVEDAVVVDQAPPRLVPGAGDPGDHVAAIGAAERTGAAGVQPGIFRLGRRPALLQVFQRPVAPVLDDGLGEGFAVAGGAVEIDHHHGVAHAGPDLRVPAVAPGVPEGAVRAAVDQEGHRVLGPGMPAVGLDHIAMDGLAVPAGEGEGLVGRHGRVGQGRGVGVGEPAGRAGLGQFEQLLAGDQAVLAVDHASAGDGHIADMADVGQGRDLAPCQVDGRQPLEAGVAEDGVEGLAVRRPGQLFGRAVVAGVGLLNRARLQVEDEDAGADIFAAAARLADVGDPGPVRRGGRR